jgi:hypothetical protein
MGFLNSSDLDVHEAVGAGFGAEVYTKLEDVPNDEYDHLLDGDNALLAAYPDGLPEVRSLASVAPTNTALLKPRMLVKLPRTIEPGMKGKDVVAVQRALWRMHQRKIGTFNGNYGYWTKRQIQSFQHNHGIKPDGVYGPLTHSKLAPVGFDAYSAYLMGHVSISHAPTMQQRIVETAIFAYNKRYNIHYTQSSMRMQGVRERKKPPLYPSWEDCSSITTWYYWVANAPDPNGNHYNLLGYTGTLASNGHATTHPKPGDIILYGSVFPYHHVAVYIGGGRCISHGSEIGPLMLSAYYRPDLNHFRTYFA